jgi:ubiquinone/menaquinone biosynthesis C-methylase UbiE
MLELIGIDADPIHLKKAVEKTSLLATNVQFHLGYAQKLPLGANVFDLAVSSLFFHHLNNKQKRESLAEIYRVLKLGGRLLIADWGMPSSFAQRAAFILVQILDGFESMRDSVEGALPSLIGDSDFTDVESCDYIAKPLGTIRLSSANKRCYLVR